MRAVRTGEKYANKEIGLLDHWKVLLLSQRFSIFLCSTLCLFSAIVLVETSLVLESGVFLGCLEFSSGGFSFGLWFCFGLF